MNYQSICRSLICFSVLTLLPAPAWSDEPAPVPGVKKQRVSPKLLREAMSTPEYRARVNAPAAPSIDQIQKLADKLKANGDNEGCELLQSFVQEHQRLANQSSAKADSSPSFSVRCQLVSLNDAEIAPDSILKTASFDNSGNLNEQQIEAFSKELDRAVHEKKGTRLLGPVTLTAHAHKATHFHHGGVHAIATSDGSVPKNMHETGTILDVMVTPEASGTNKVELTLQLVSDETSANPAVVNRKAHTTVDLKNGGTSIIAVPGSDHENKVVLVTKVVRNAVEMTAVPRQ